MCALPLHPIWGLHADGGLACSEKRASRAPRAYHMRKGVEGTDRSGNHHVTATRNRFRLAQERECHLPMEGTSGVAASFIFTES